MKKKAKILISVMTLLGSIALCGCGGDKTTESTTAAPASTTNSSSQEATTGGSVVVGMTQDLVSLDPHIETDAGTRNVVFNLYDGLVKATSSGDLESAVAESYVISEDATSYTFTLREGVTFHDGSPVTAQDVKYSIDRYAESGINSAFSIFQEIRVDDEKTVTVVLKEGNSEFLAELTTAIIPESNENPGSNPIGTGPFKFVSYEPGQKLVLTRYDGYWKEGFPKLDQVEFKFVADMETAYMELQAGTLDILNYLTADQVAALGDGYNIVEGSMNLVHAMYLNNAYEPLTDLRVRQALCYAVDRQAINDFLFGGKSKLIGTHMIPAMSKYYNDATTDTYSYDPEKAKALLAEAGYANGFDLVISVPSSYSQHVATAEIIVEQLKAVGINASISAIEWSSWLSDVYQGRDFQATVVGVDGKLSPNDWFKKYVSTSSNNFMNYSNPEFDSTFDAAMATIDDAEKVQLYKELQQMLADDAVNVYIEDPADFVAVNSALDGYVSYPIAAQDLSTVYYK